MANGIDESQLTEQEKRERNARNNAQNLRNAAEVAIASKEGHAAAIGAAVKVADKATGGKSTEALGKALERSTRHSIGGKRLQNASNKLAESGASDKIGKAASMYNGAQGGGGVSGLDGLGQKNGIPGGGQGGSLPSSNVPKTSSGVDANASADSGSGSGGRNIAGVPSANKGSILGNKDDDFSSEDDKSSGTGNFKVLSSPIVKIAIITFAPFMILLFLIFIVVAFVAGVFSDYDDAFGISHLSGSETGEVYFESSNPEQQAYFDRIMDLKSDYQSSGKTVDPLKVVAVFHVLNTYGADLDYPDLTSSVISDVIDAMFDGNMYSESYFKENLMNDIIPKYISDTDEGTRELIVENIFNYIEDYYNIIGKDTSGTCASTGSCSYDVKGFYIPGGAGNVAKNVQISNLKVRLMECGSPYGNGSYNTPIQQDLVDFESYIAGVAYAEVGTGAPDEAIKAQMVAARSFALSRPTAMGNSLGKKLEEENGQWILQIASCVADQVFCNIDEGCSYMGGGDGQGGIVRSGIVPGAYKTREALAQDHHLRQLAKETEGEVLVNSQGYIIAAGFLSTDQNQFSAMANSGLNYKQILLQHYNQGSRNYGASDVVKASCGSGSTSACHLSSGEYAQWKQFNAPWSGVAMGSSNIGSVGCLATSIAILIAKSGVPTILDDFNPGTFVAYLNSHGGFGPGGDFLAYTNATLVAPNFVYDKGYYISGMSRDQKLQTISNILNDGGYPLCEVKGGHGQHWVAIDAVQGDTVYMMDPGSNNNILWDEYPWEWTSTCHVYKVNG